MRDIFFLAYILTLFVGIAALITALFLYFRFRKAVFLFYFLFMTAVTVVFLINTLLQYGPVHFSEYRWKTFSILVGGSAYLLLVFSAPLFVHELMQLSASKIARFGIAFNCLLVGGFAAAFLLSRREVFYSLAQIAFLPSVFYSLFILFAYYRKIEQKLLRKAIWNFLFISLTLLPFIVIDIFSSRIPLISRLVPEKTSFSLLLFYLAWNIVNLVYSVRHFFRPAESDAAFMRSAVTESYSVTDREYSIIELIAEGHGNKQIASQLNISEQTVKNHIYNIYKKTGVFSRVELINKINTLKNTL
jgi:DNA-binding CsgD family transcriptional regulator